MGTLEESGPVIKSHLNKPPQVLLKAMKLLQLNHGFGKGNMWHYIDQVTRSNMPGMEAARHPGGDNDQLFQSGYKHKDGDTCLGCDTSKIVARAKRESTRAEVHYGQIASGNMVMRNAKKRDTLRKMWRVICLEMEAAGLMDNFPCTVIRGICDYSDSHKNKQWQAYAALTAAAYAKDLLMTVQPEEVELTPPANDIMNGERLRHWDGIGPPPPGKGDGGGGGGSGGSGGGAGGGGNWSVPPRFRLPPVQSLWAAIRNRNIRRIRLLLRMGVNPNIRDHRNGRNSLHKAAYWNRPTAARILIPYMNNINAEDDKGLTALDVAKKRGHGAVARVLRNHGAS